MRVAIVHDWLTGMRGGERCLLKFLSLYPQADIFCLVHIPGSTDPEIDRRVKAVSFLNRIPGISRFYRLLLPLFPLAAKQLKVEGYDLVISLSHAAAKNAAVDPSSCHICYCFTPMRYIWDQAEAYFGWKRYPLYPILRWLRSWDRSRAKRVNQFVAISAFISSRIRRYYGRRSTVIFPPVRMDWPALAGEAEERAESFLYAGALVPYKRVDWAAAAFEQLPEEKLEVVGEGPRKGALQESAPQNVSFRSAPSDAELALCYKRSRALIFPAREDFGMIPVEAMSTGLPVIAADTGANRETVRGVRPWLGEEVNPSYHTGVFFRVRGEVNPVAELRDAIRYFIAHETRFRGETCQRWAQHFSEQAFESRWGDFLRKKSGTAIGERRAEAEAAAI